MDDKKLKVIIDNHGMWLRDEPGSKRANLRGANLRGADLREANLSGADLREADLSGAILTNANIPDFLIAPEEGAFIAYKKIRGDIILTLSIPKSAERVNKIGGRKIRVSKAEVLKAENMRGNLIKETEFCSKHNENYIWKLGKVHTPEQPFNDDTREECASGLHCFITKKEAREY